MFTTNVEIITVPWIRLLDNLGHRMQTERSQSIQKTSWSLLDVFSTFRLRLVSSGISDADSRFCTHLGWSSLWWWLVIDWFFRKFLLGCLTGWRMRLCGLILFIRFYNSMKSIVWIVLLFYCIELFVSFCISIVII